MRTVRRILKVLAVLIVVVALAATAFGVTTVRASFPQTTGTLSEQGLDGTVQILRDDKGIPQIYATTDHDLMFGQGYAHAQDRFWEMDFRRHVTAGRLSELFGKSQLETDEFLRTLGWRRVAEREVKLLKPETLSLLRAYADGVNAWLAEHKSARSLSLEYAILGLQVKNYVPEQWSEVDSIAWLKAMAWDLRGNLDDELDRTIAAAAVGTTRAEELYPSYPFDINAPIVTSGGVRDFTTFDQNAPALLNTAGTMARISALIAKMPSYFGTKTPGIGSNSWVVSGQYTESGKPILSNDPHLEASMPSIWTQVGLHCENITSACSFNVAGWSFSGFPGVVIGHNARVGWGFTNLGPDVADLVVEQVSGNSYSVDGVDRAITTVVEPIKVAGGETVQWKARATEHGPLISDASKDFAGVAKNTDGNAVALRWTALTPGTTADAVFTLDRSSDWASFREAAREFDVPSQNLIYADVDGNIGYQAPGIIPIRRGYDGRWPVPGWESKYGWDGYIPFEALPSEYNPRDGFIVTANQAVIHANTYPYFLTSDWSYGARAQRIRDVLTADIKDAKKFSLQRMQQLQMDTRSEIGTILLPVALKEISGTAADVLQKWADDGYRMDMSDTPGAALFASFWRHLALDTFRDELPASYPIDGEDRWFEVMRWLVTDPTNAWWDDTSTKDKVESMHDIMVRALDEAQAELTKRFGSVAKARWSAMHQLTLTNATFGASGIKPIEMLFNRGPVGVAGSSSVVLATGWKLDTSYDVTWLPSMRQVLDLSNWDNSTWVHLTGQSGHAYSSHYVDQFDAWVHGKTFAWPFTTAAVTAATKDTLTLARSSS